MRSWTDPNERQRARRRTLLMWTLVTLLGVVGLLAGLQVGS